MTSGDLGSFLRSRRARLNPADFGLPTTHRRRVPGLRREELAVLVGVSQDYYGRLEQGRQSTASRSVLDAMAQALRLSQDERKHLYTLAGAVDPGSSGVIASNQEVSPRISRVVELLGSTPAIVCGPYTEILAANDAACFLLGDFMRVPKSERYGVRWALSPDARALYGDEWESFGAAMIGLLRLKMGQHPRDRMMDGLVTELTAESPIFRKAWADHYISGGLPASRMLNHPIAGRLEFTSEQMTFYSVPEQTLFLIIPRDVSKFESAFRRSSLKERGRSTLLSL